MLHKKRPFAFHTDLSRIFQPKISCAVFSFPAFSHPAFLCHIFHAVSHFPAPQICAAFSCLAFSVAYPQQTRVNAILVANIVRTVENSIWLWKLKHNTHPRRRRDSTVESCRVGGVYCVCMNSQLAHDDCQFDKKLSNCWETVRRESMPRIAEMDVEMTT